MVSQTIFSILKTIFWTTIAMLGSSLVAYLIVKIRKWYLMRKQLKPKTQTQSKGYTLQQYVEQIDSIRYMDEWPPTQRVIQIFPDSKSPSTIQSLTQKGTEKTIDKSLVLGDIMINDEVRSQKLNKTLPV